MSSGERLKDLEEKETNQELKGKFEKQLNTLRKDCKFRAKLAGGTVIESELYRRVGNNLLLAIEQGPNEWNCEDVFLILKLTFEGINQTTDDVDTRAEQKILLWESGFLLKVLVSLRGEANVTEKTMILLRKMFSVLFFDKDIVHMISIIRKEHLSFDWMLEMLQQSRSDEDWQNLFNEILKEASESKDKVREDLSLMNKFLLFEAGCPNAELVKKLNEELSKI